MVEDPVILFLIQLYPVYSKIGPRDVQTEYSGSGPIENIVHSLGIVVQVASESFTFNSKSIHYGF